MTNSSSGARRAPLKSQETLVHSDAAEALCRAAADPGLSEDLALSLLQRRDLAEGVIERLSKNAAAIKSRKVLMGVAAHPRTPAYIALPIARGLYTFELMQLALSPAAAPAIKTAAEEALITRLETLASGERLSLAKRASGRVAAALLRDPEARVVRAALENPHMTEAGVMQALMRPNVPAQLVQVACRHPKWSLRRDIRIALLRNPDIPLVHALAFAQSLPPPLLRDVLQVSRMSDSIKAYLRAQLEIMPKKRKRIED